MVKKASQTRRPPHGNIIITAFALILFALLLISPKASIEYMRASLALCVKSLVPSLFPFMIISDFLISGCALSFIRAVLSVPISKAFGLSGDGACAALLGLVCGFPIGAKCALRLYNEKKISHAELSHIMSFCNIPSSAFVCGTVSVMLGSAKLGIILYVSLLLSSLVIGLVGRGVYKYDRIPPSSATSPSEPVTAFTSAVTSSVPVMLNVCAYVVFFSVVIGYIKSLCTALNLPDAVSVLLSGLLEISGGMSSLYPLPTLLIPPTAAFFLGFSGLSVCFQIWSIDKNRCISRKIFIFQKLIQGILCSSICFVLTRIFPLSIRLSADTMTKITFHSYSLYICILFFISSALPLLATLAASKKSPKRSCTPLIQKRKNQRPSK